MKVNNVGKILFFKRFSEDCIEVDLDLVLLQCQVSFNFLVQSAKE